MDVEIIDEVVRRALDEDIRARGTNGPGVDLTSDNAVPAAARARGRLVAKATGRLAGIEVFARVFELCDPEATVERLASDGDEIRPGQELARLEGNARALLLAERTALNLIQRMSGSATLTANYVARTGGKARILDTRKTTPGLRAFEKYAVTCGGGENHRIGLYDEVMVKDNHTDLAGKPLADVVRAIRAAVGPDVKITSEARDEAEALAGIEGGANIVMLDNMSPAMMTELCPRLRKAAELHGRPVELEASGGIGEDDVADVAASGVDRISIGALTHSAPALDLSLYLEPAP
jgi:nicotinate-nucleotide pyrophosphorylase (carboxylating)